MKLLLIQGGSRWKFDTEGQVYTDSNFNQTIWDRYTGYGGDWTVLLRREAGVYAPELARARFNPCSREKLTCAAVPDLYRPVRNVFRPSVRRRIRTEIDRRVREADKVIIRSLGNFYTDTAVRCCRRHGKPYLVEVTGFAWEGMWYHSLRGKLVAPWKELQCRRLLGQAPWAVYVTEQALQRRYPAPGRTLGCSDVELPPLERRVLARRMEKIRAGGSRLVLGTAGFLDVTYKGQKSVIEALALLKRAGFSDIEYQMAGSGTGERLLALAKRLGVAQQVKLVGSLPHHRMAAWYDQLDLYVHPSWIEGLCRSVLEAMSRGCPVICARVGGNVELADPACLFEKKNARQIAALLQRLADPAAREAQARRSFARARAFDSRALDQTRKEFYQSFIHETK